MLNNSRPQVLTRKKKRLEKWAATHGINVRSLGQTKGRNVHVFIFKMNVYPHTHDVAFPLFVQTITPKSHFSYFSVAAAASTHSP